MTRKANNRYKFTFGNRTLTLTTTKDNLFMEEVEHLAQERYEELRRRQPDADQETLAIMLAINSLSTQLAREKAYEQLEKELTDLRQAQEKEELHD